MSDDCLHKFNVVGVSYQGRGALSTGVFLECEDCGGIKFEKREKIHD